MIYKERRNNEHRFEGGVWGTVGIGMREGKKGMDERGCMRRRGREERRERMSGKRKEERRRG